MTLRTLHAAALAPLVLSLAACRIADVASLNLDTLHGQGGRHRVYAEELGELHYAAHELGRTYWSEGSAPEVDKEAVENPSERCLEYLLELASFGADGGHVEALQVRSFAYLAVVCPWSLSRERAFIELAKHAPRVNLKVPLTEPQDVDPAALVEALKALGDVVYPLFKARGRSSPDAAGKLAAACQRVLDTPFDLEGGRRVLQLLAAYARDSETRRAFFEPLRELNLESQRRMLSFALQHGLKDPHPMVRAAAFEANYATYGDRFLSEALDQLLRVGRPPDALPALFEFIDEWEGDEQVFVALFDLLSAHGLPSSAIGENDAALGKRRAYLFGLCQVAVSYTAYGDRTRTHAMLALSAVSGAGFQSVRLEEWQKWWKETSAASAGRTSAGAETVTDGR